MRAIVTAALLALSWPMAGLAQSAAVLSGQAGGEEMTWHLVELEGGSGSYWADMGTLHQVTVFAFPDADGLSLEGALEFSLTLDNRTDPMRAIGAQVAFYPEGRQRPFAVPPSREGRVEVTLEESAITGGRLHLRGRLQTPLQRLLDPNSARFDPEDTIEIELDFEVTVAPL